MIPTVTDEATRRSVLRTAGVISLASIGGLTGTAGAKPDRKGNNFGNGNGIGAFLNEEAEFKDSPIWDRGGTNLLGEESVEVAVGASTSVNVPAPGGELPVAFAPHAIQISRGTTVTWKWLLLPFPIPHDVVSLEESGGGPLFNSGYKTHTDASDPAPTFDYTFDERGTYLYYCTPHGAPFEVHEMGDPSNPLVYNEFGMRGAVLVR